MTDCPTKSVVRLLQRRQLGLPLKENGRSVRAPRNNYRCDYELLKALMSDKHSYLEVIACCKISRSDKPSFCNNRLFTNNYRSWFNLCTSPTAGPSLMKTNIFSKDESCSNETPSFHRPRIIDAVAVYSPNGCTPQPNSQHMPCMLFLTRTGWIYQFCVEDASCLNELFLPTQVFADETSELCNSANRRTLVNGIRRTVLGIKFNYQYISLNGNEGNVLIQSTVCVVDQVSYVAYIVLGLFPLRVLHHFITKSSKSNFKAELWEDLFMLTSKSGSAISLYALKDIASFHKINSSHIQIGRNLYIFDEYHNHITAATVGGTRLGIPYTLEPIDLDLSRTWVRHQLFKTKAKKNILRVGGVPYHYAVTVDKNCTSWSLRDMADSTELLKFHVDEKWDNSHIFHPDDSGRIILISKDTVTLYKIECRGTSCTPSSVRAGKAVVSKMLTSNSVTQQDFQLRVNDSPLFASSKQRTFNKRVIKCFEIKINQEKDGLIKKDSGDDEIEEINWQYPTASSNNPRSSYGRRLRQPDRYVSTQTDGSEFGVLGVNYENEMDILAVLHFKDIPKSPQHTLCTGLFDLVVSLYDNLTGRLLNSVIVDQDLHSSDASDVQVILDEDTIIYTRTEMPDLLNYKIMRFCRKY